MIKLPNIFLYAGLILSACTHPEPESNQLPQVVLLDVQGLTGGQDLWISSLGTAFCRVVTPAEDGESGLQEARYQFMLSEEQRSDLSHLLAKHDFFKTQTKDRYGVPDEARPSIFVEHGTRSHAIGKWANDKHEKFDTVYEFLLRLVESGKKGKRFHSGELEWRWQPDGFPENEKIWELTRPKVENE